MLCSYLLLLHPAPVIFPTLTVPRMGCSSVHVVSGLQQCSFFLPSCQYLWCTCQQSGITSVEFFVVPGHMVLRHCISRIGLGLKDAFCVICIHTI